MRELIDALARWDAAGDAAATAGMAAALPHVDAFVGGHNLEAMSEVLEEIGAS